MAAENRTFYHLLAKHGVFKGLKESLKKSHRRKCNRSIEEAEILVVEKAIREKKSITLQRNCEFCESKVFFEQKTRYP